MTALRRLPRLGIALLALFVGCAPASKPLEFTESGKLKGTEEARQETEQKQDILRSVVRLIRTAATSPGGDNFTLAAEQLNDFFRNADPAEFELPESERRFLETQPSLPPGAPNMILNPKFSGLHDGRHIEDCLLYRSVARAILEREGAAAANDLARARRIFAWVVRQIQLVPPGSLGAPSVRGPDGLPFQAPVRPYDALLRGMATETGLTIQESRDERGGEAVVEEIWGERSWLFLVLCQQVGLESALLVVAPPPPPSVGVLQPGESVRTRPEVLGCGVVIDGRVYLFDARLGLEVPGPGGEGVATLEQAAADPAILDALDLPDQPYPLDAADLAGGKVHVLLDSTLGTLSPRMMRLQENLTGDNRMVLYRDPSERAAVFAKALGDRLGVVRLWHLPLDVEYRLFHVGAFTQSTLYSIRIFDARWPLLQARLEQLRGETDQAIHRYASFLNVDDLVESDGTTPIPAEVRAILNRYATYFLALAQLDKGRDDQAGFLFRRTLEDLPEPDRGLPYFFMFRYGAQANLGRLHESQGRPDLAVRYYVADDPTSQGLGNRLRARPLILDDPFVPPPDLPRLPDAPRPEMLGTPGGVAARE